MPLLNHFQKVSTFGIAHGRETEIVNDQHMGLGELVDGLAVASVTFGQSHLIGELGGADIEGAVSFPAGLVGQGACEEGFPRSLLIIDIELILIDKVLLFGVRSIRRDDLVCQ